MFAFKHGHPKYVDLSSDLVDERDFKPSHLATLEYIQDVRVLAFEPLASLLAVGTSSGMIWIFGAPGVQECIKVSDRPLKLLDFAPSVSKLVAVDEADRFYVWDLSRVGHPLRQASVRFYESINSITISPSHTHAFLVFHSGTIKTYDLLCLRVSPYIIPNMWLEFEQKTSATGIPGSHEPGLDIAISLTIHPRDLNLIFVCYAGATILGNLKERNSLRVYEYILPAGAPGPLGYSSPDILKHRRPGVTALAIHPAGHFFAVGYADGSIAFWAIEDESQPLLVRTLTDIDINVVDADKLSEVLEADEGKNHKKTLQPLEPIYKLSWSGYANSSDPRGGSTTLTVLGGGMQTENVQGVTTLLLPAFNPMEPSDVKPDQGLSSFMRAAMRQCVLHAEPYTYTSTGTVQDYLLLPREGPHFSNCFDPVAIIILSDGCTIGTRSTEIYEFPPAIFELKPVTQGKPDAVQALDIDDISQDLASTLESMSLAVEPRRFVLPTPLWNDGSNITGGHIIKLDKEPYSALLRSGDELDSEAADYSLKGGISWVDDTDDEFRHAKFQPHRILLTRHCDLTIRFQDVSVQLLISSESSPVSTAFPCPLPHLTIDLVTALSDPSVLARCSPDALQEGSIHDVYISPESLECTIILKTGDVFVYKFEAGSSAPGDNLDAELVLLEHIPTPPGQKYRPFLMIPSARGPVSAFASSDIGFLAISYIDGSLFVIDMRGPLVILRELRSRQRNRQSFLKRSEDHVDSIVSLTWGIFRLQSDAMPHVRLIATRVSGHASVYTMIRDPTSGTFSVAIHATPLEAMAAPLPVGSILLESRTGARCSATKSRFASSLGNIPAQKDHDVFWISVGAKGVSCVLNVDGDRIAKQDWNSKAGHVESVQIVQRHNACVLVAFTDKKEILIHSIPYLEPMHALEIPRVSVGCLSIDDTGDYVEWIHDRGRVTKCCLGTLFSLRRQFIYRKQVTNLMANVKPIPAQPHPVSMSPASLLSQVYSYFGGYSASGEQIDDLLGGPDRPVPEKQASTTEWLAAVPVSGVGAGSSSIQAASAGVGDLYNRLGAAISERGQMLDGLEDTVTSLQKGSKEMLAQAKKLATEQSARGWFTFG